MKVTILNEYRDKGLNRLVKVGEVLDIDEDRYNVLQSIGVDCEEYIEDENQTLDDDLDDEDENPTLDNDSGDDLDDEDLHGYSETDRQLELIGAYKDDKNIVDELLAPDLKIICDEFDVNYTNVTDAKEALKILTIG